MKIKSTIICILTLFVICGPAKADEWSEKESEHFIIRYIKGENEEWVGQVLREAENNYRKIAGEVGYARYANFWTWDKRVQIVMYKDRQHFVQSTGQPIWAIGGVQRDNTLFSTKRIISYKQEVNFLESVLPHEIAHLIVYDYFASKVKIPKWFDEGLAQIFEDGKVEKSNDHLRTYLKKNSHIKFSEFNTYDPRFEVNLLKVSYFYIQSVSVVDFLMRQYGNTRFVELCSLISSGNSFNEAFRKSYLGVIDGLEDLEKKWLSYIVY